MRTRARMLAGTCKGVIGSHLAAQERDRITRKAADIAEANRFLSDWDKTFDIATARIGVLTDEPVS